ncbi:hypothetical protein JOF53_005885 [Crossiella equi]|uniref:Transglutaminase-like domain-containing protein n=1 Tax=Crossiella equi TaxID=130796 RepID=A0ABS5AKC1_9PSEU|nr:transglutaminase-like domain-containing protein [Crossiella equi]MBP2477013.1 hypothetical protein [Crossiella equi]
MASSFTAPGPLTAPGRHSAQVAALPGTPPALTERVQDWLLHEMLGDLYGVRLTEDERRTTHLRSTEELLDEVLARAPLAESRTPDRRVPVNCRHFATTLVTLLRAHGIPARARCGFGAYFTPGFHEDHWAAEYWTGTRWALADAQLDPVQRKAFGIGFDPLDVPRTAFQTAGGVWLRCRAGLADPATYGLTATHESGLWWVAANLVRDATALCGNEVLPWDVWGVMPGPTDDLTRHLPLFDHLARLAEAPDARRCELTALLADPRLRRP